MLDTEHSSAALPTEVRSAIFAPMQRDIVK
jgi:hypothetical protein